MCGFWGTQTWRHIDTPLNHAWQGPQIKMSSPSPDKSPKFDLEPVSIVL